MGLKVLVSISPSWVSVGVADSVLLEVVDVGRSTGVLEVRSLSVTDRAWVVFAEVMVVKGVDVGNRSRAAFVALPLRGVWFVV